MNSACLLTRVTAGFWRNALDHKSNKTGVVYLELISCLSFDAMWHLTHSKLFVCLHLNGLCWETRWFDPRGWWYNCTTCWGHGTTGGWIRSDGKLGLRSILLLLQNYCAIKSFVLPSFYDFLSTFSKLRTSFCLAVLHKRPKMNFVNTFPFLKCCNQSRITLCRQKNHQRGFSNCPHVFVTELSVVKLLFAWFPHRAKIASQAGEMCKDAFFQTISLRTWGTWSCPPRKAQVFSSKLCKVPPALGVLPYAWQKGFWWSSQILWKFRGTEFQIIHGKCNPCRLIDDPMRNSLGV